MDRAEPRDSWLGTTAVIIAGGPSLAEKDVKYVKRCWLKSPNIRIIAINESWRLAADAHILYAADPDWCIQRGPRQFEHSCERWTQDKNWRRGEAQVTGWRQIKSRTGANISFSPDYIYQGGNSSFQAMNLAILFGSRRIVFLGLDLSPDGDKTHWHEYPDKFKREFPGYEMFKKSFEDVVPILLENGVEVINASRRTVLECFERMTIQEALSGV